jgi:ABC-type polysaccharide/polyol phosphate export permease
LGINLVANLAELAQYKELIWTHSVHRIKVRYEQSVLGAPERWRPFYVFNAMVAIIENFRQVMLTGTPYESRSLLRSASISVTLLVGSYLYFELSEATMANYV